MVPLIECRDLSLAYEAGRPVINGVNLAVAPGEFLGIVGPSGCGKSTLLRLVAGLRTPTAGTVRAEVPEDSTGQARDPLAFVFQDPTLLPWRNVRENIALPLELRGQGRRERHAAADAMLPLIGLSGDDARKRPRELSGGMRMRVSLARALVTNPHVLLLDEPFAALDEVLRQQLNEELVRLWEARRCTTLFVTHNISEAAFMCQRIVVMDGPPGRIVDAIDVDLPRPRTAELRLSPAFAARCQDIAATLRRRPT